MVHVSWKFWLVWINTYERKETFIIVSSTYCATVLIDTVQTCIESSIQAPLLISYKIVMPIYYKEAMRACWNIISLCATAFEFKGGFLFEFCFRQFIQSICGCNIFSLRIFEIAIEKKLKRFESCNRMVSRSRDEMFSMAANTKILLAARPSNYC